MNLDPDVTYIINAYASVINKVALQFVTASKARTKGYAPSSSSSAILASLSPVSSIRLPLRRGALSPRLLYDAFQ
jgi:hypothetical protein